MARYRFLVIILFIFSVFSCTNEDNLVPVDVVEEPESSLVVFDIDAVPYQTLSAYNFFEGDIAQQEPVNRVLPYDLISPLFSDYAKKKRFVWMPEGVSATYTADNTILNFPNNAVIIKTFYYDNVLPISDRKILETRLIIKKNNTYVFANYKWNDEQTEAFLDNNGSFEPVSFIKDGAPFEVNYRIPSEAECQVCHKSPNENAIPIGPKPQNLNRNFNYKDGIKNQLQKWVEIGYLNNNIPDAINTVVSFEDESQPLELRARSYLDINCAHCHSEGAHCAYRPLRLSFTDTENPTNAGVCVGPEEQIDTALTHLVSPGRSDRSVLLYRLNTTDVSVRMPLLSRSVKHEEGVALIEAWINSLNTSCE